MTIRMRFSQFGDHVHVRVFTSTPNGFALVGRLTILAKEWAAFRTALPGVDFVEDAVERVSWDA